MIQRIQTVYLLLAGIFPAFTFFTPVAFFAKGFAWANLNSMGYETANVPELAGSHPWALLAFSLLSIIIAFVALGGYRNRKRQLRWITFALLSNFCWYLSLGFYAFTVSEAISLPLSFTVSSLIPLVAMVLLWMARKAIRYDEQLVKAADRIR